MPKFQTILKLGIGLAIGLWAADAFVLRSGPNDPTGFVTVEPGSIADIAGRALTAALAVWFVRGF